jgi:uncharacterized phage protein (TIGR01671 family)
MRELKFRLWDKHEKKMIYAEEATNSKEILAIGLHGLPIAIDATSFKCDQGDEVTAWNVDHYITPMQCTGMNDKYRKDIYEGDIVRVEGVEIGWVVYDNAAGAFRIQSFKFWHHLFQIADIEVIGNIYENPELVK